MITQQQLQQQQQQRQQQQVKSTSTSQITKWLRNNILLVLIIFILIAYFLEIPFATKMIIPQYKLPNQESTHWLWAEYGTGVDDVYLVVFMMLLMGHILVMARIFLQFFAEKVGKCTSKAVMKKFLEQGWLFIYYMGSITIGLSIMSYMNYSWYTTRPFWAEYPNKLFLVLKWYYAFQVSFWLQQLILIHYETKRADHWGMFIHHVITVLLIFSSYFANFTHGGHAICTLFDLADILLTLAKLLRYLRMFKLCDFVFATFTLTWLYTRHYVFVYYIIFSLYEMPIYAEYVWDPSRGLYLNDTVWYFYFITLWSLEVLMVYWFIMILGVIYRAMSGHHVNDLRSDEDEDTESDKQKTE